MTPFELAARCFDSCSHRLIGARHDTHGRATDADEFKLWNLTQDFYGCCMAEVASSELWNQTRALLDRVEAGETVTITVDGRPVAVLAPVGRRPRWLSRDEFVRRIVLRQADAALGDEFRELAPDATDDLPWR